MPKVVRSRRANRDVEGIVAYLASENLSAPIRWLNDMLALFELMAAQPHMGEEIATRRLGRVRRFTKGSYVVYFRPIAGGVHIARIYHGSRDHERLV